MAVPVTAPSKSRGRLRRAAIVMAPPAEHRYEAEQPVRWPRRIIAAGDCFDRQDRDLRAAVVVEQLGWIVGDGPASLRTAKARV